MKYTAGVKSSIYRHLQSSHCPPGIRNCNILTTKRHINGQNVKMVGSQRGPQMLNAMFWGQGSLLVAVFGCRLLLQHRASECLEMCGLPISDFHQFQASSWRLTHYMKHCSKILTILSATQSNTVYHKNCSKTTLTILTLLQNNTHYTKHHSKQHWLP